MNDAVVCVAGQACELEGRVIPCSIVLMLKKRRRTLGVEDKDLLIARPRSGVLKPSYFLLFDHRMKSVVLLVRGTQSVKVKGSLTHPYDLG